MLLKLILLFASATLFASAQTTVLYRPDSPTVGPFPSNVLTTLDTRQATGLRIAVGPAFDSCGAGTSPSVCSNTNLLNQLDGFSVNPRIMVCFSSPIDPSTLQDGISLTPVGKGSSIGINQIVYDPASNCAFAKPQTVLAQQSQYLLLVSDSVLDISHARVSVSPAFTACLGASSPYCSALSQALGKNVKKLVSASLFTTMSATAWMQQAQQYVAATQLPLVIPAGFPFQFPVSSLKSITWVPQDNTGTAANQQSIPPSALQGVGSIAFGLFLSPNFLSLTDGTIATTPTGSFTAAPVAIPNVGTRLPVSFHVFLPSSPAPKGGYPVVIYGHGLGDSQFGAPTYIASTLAKNGYATLAFEITGHGFGPGGTVQLKNQQNAVSTVAAPGRGIAITSPVPDGGCFAGVPAVAVRDCGRQTAIDLFALVRTIQLTDGLGINLDPSHISYIGQSFGATYGSLFLAADSTARAAVFSGAGGTSVDVARLSITGRPLAIGFLSSLGLLNDPARGFNDSYALRDMPPMTTPSPGAMRIQAAFEAADWLGMVGDPLSFAPHLQSPTLFQFGFGDLEVPNPTESAVIRAAGAQDNAWFFNYNQAVALYPELATITMPSAPTLPILPHRILSNPTIFSFASEQTIALAEQQQAADFIGSDGKSKSDPNKLLPKGFVPGGVKLFETPKSLPEQLNFPF